MTKLWELESAIHDAADALTEASRLALEISGFGPSRLPDEGYGDPGSEGAEGWPAMVRLCDLLGGLATAVKAAVPPEILDAVKAEADADDGYESPEAMGLRP